MKKTMMVFSLLLIGALAFASLFRGGIIFDTLGVHVENPLKKTVRVPEVYAETDENGNGVADPIDIVNAARKEVEQRTEYKSGYYAGGYPPEDEGVCTDVVWRGFLGADIVLKELIDQDIAEHTGLYPGVHGNPDPNIDFRRVPNQYIFFERHAESLTTELIPGNVENLKKWQPGDIVMFLDGYHHVAVISDKRAKNGVPYVIQNNEPFASEVKLTSFSTPIAAHYRWKY